MNAATILQSKKTNIIHNWYHEVQTKMPEISKYNKSAIENSLPALLDTTIDALKSNDIEALTHSSKEHGLQRTQLEVYSLQHIVKEYHLLKMIIFEKIDEQTNITPVERNIIIQLLDHAIEQACETFYRIKQKMEIDARENAEEKANLLQREDENRDQFIYSISHDLNNPLNNIKASVSLIESGLEKDEMNEVLNVLRNSIAQAEKLIANFLDVSTVGHNSNITVSKQEVNLLKRIENEIEIYKVSRNRNINLKSDQEQIFANVDIDLIIRAFANLMSNALKYSKKNEEINVNINLQNRKIILGIQNKGEVIPQNSLQQIFRKYYQLDDSKKGWGIGLAFVKEVIEAHGGEIEVTSTEEEGTLFKVTLPAD